MYYAGVILKSGHVQGQSFSTKGEAEDYILNLAEKEGIKRGQIRNTQTGEEEIISF